MKRSSKVVRVRKQDGRQRRELLARCEEYEEQLWVDELDLNCEGLLREFERKQKGLTVPRQCRSTKTRYVLRSPQDDGPSLA